MSAEILKIPAGFRFAATKAGIKASGNADLALIEAPDGATAAAVFTKNLVVAAPVIVGRKHLSKSAASIRAVLVNAGNANCATGNPGLKASEKSCEHLARALRSKAQQIIPSSTGVIGVPFPTEKLLAGLPSLLAARGDTPEHAMDFARAIMTTDTRPKIATAEVTTRSGKASILGIAKGAGMIHPNMATMLCYIVTDVEGAPKQLNQALKSAVDRTFNRISIDGDTSTNDTVCLMASGKSGIKLGKGSADKSFSAALFSVCSSLAEQIIADGEGVKHVVRLNILEAKSEQEADGIARTIAHSPLVKTAWTGTDPNWGRILAAVGRSGIVLDPGKIDIFFGPIQVCRHGMAARFDEREAHEYLSQAFVDISVRLRRGKHNVSFLTCDLTSDYVHINADYRT
ncbi:MAG TPA: bifunctional glutamate N-acetyltransferase/amino-acid acetyltransferase ArgJ [Terriglobales bacterium]|nr:bifunctional glutamate N-acetyltransferase/amino-acid acetyltransferase ArgJ [Terriglobales bacterium]